jgi:uncharacterized protein
LPTQSENPGAGLARDPLFGNIFENMVVMEFFKYGHNTGETPHLYFYRDHNQNELDLIYPKGSCFVPIEIKSSRTYNPQFQKGIQYIQKISGQSDKGMVIYDGDLRFENEQAVVTNFREMFGRLQHSVEQ